MADALSRVQGAEVLCLAISVVQSGLQRAIVDSYAQDPQLSGIIQDL